jgi:hypothetical protein
MCNKICGICGKEITEDEHRECISKKYSNNLSDLLTYWS